MAIGIGLQNVGPVSYEELKEDGVSLMSEHSKGNDNCCQYKTSVCRKITISPLPLKESGVGDRVIEGSLSTY